MKSRPEGTKIQAVCETEAEPCLYCGKPTLSRNYIVNPGAEQELHSCSKECFDKAKEYIEQNAHHKFIYYLTLLILVVANLFLLGFEVVSRWKYLPMLGISIAIYLRPLVFISYQSYQKFGMRKTITIIRVFAVVISLFALVLIVTNKM